MLLPQLFLTLILLALCSFAPGFLFVRHLRWSGLEKLCGSVALSLTLLWLAAWAVYVFAIPSGYLGICILSALAAALGIKDALQLFRGARVRRATLGYAVLLAWTLLIVLVIRNYSGAQWSGDWLEHFQRTLYFLHHFPLSTPVFGGYQLPARPPMMNVIAAIFLGVTADRFELLQLVFVFLNLLLFLPCCLMLPVVVKTRRIRILPLVALFAMNPAVMQNATYTWTKSLTACYVILAVYLYLSAWRKRDSLRMIAAFVCLASGMLVHYSAGPYVVFFALHYLLVLWRTRPEKVKELALIALASGFLLLTWFGWSIQTYGAKSTFTSNTSISSPTPYQGGNAEKVLGNMVDSLVPRVLYAPDSVHTRDLRQPYAPATLRDFAFIFYQTNLIFSMGLVGGPLVLWWLLGVLRKRANSPREASPRVRTFWIWLIASTVLVGLSVVGERDYLGSAHLTLVPMEVLGLTLLAACSQQRRWITALLVAGCAVDFSMGVLLHARVQHLDNTEQTTYFSGLGFGNGRFLIGAPGPDTIGAGAWANWSGKHFLQVWTEWQRAGAAFHAGDPALEKHHQGLQTATAQRIQEDDTIWHGWYRRHAGEIQFLGDHAGPGDTTSLLLLLAAIGLLGAMARQAPPVTAVAAGTPTSSRSRRK